MVRMNRKINSAKEDLKPFIQKELTHSRVKKELSLSIPVTPTEILFAHEYIKDNNPIKALERIGEVGKTTKKAIKLAKANKFLNNSLVLKHIQEAVMDKVERLKVTEDKTIAQLSKIAFADPAECYTADGRLLPIKEIPQHVRLCISEFKQKVFFEREGKGFVPAGTLTTIKLNNRLDALKLLMEKVIFPGKEVNTNIYNTHIENNNTQNNLNINDLDEQEIDVLLKVMDKKALPPPIKDTECKEAI